MGEITQPLNVEKIRSAPDGRANALPYRDDE